MLLCSIGAAQATVLRRHVDRAGRWITANALGWLAGLPVVFLALAVAPERPAVLRAPFAVAGGVGMGAAVAAVTGAFLVSLLRRPRSGPVSRCARSRASASARLGRGRRADAAEHGPPGHPALGLGCVRFGMRNRRSPPSL